MRPLHHRRPVILSPADYAPWRDPSIGDVERLQTMLQPYPDEDLIAYPVSPRVNRPTYGRPECIAPLA